MHPAFRVIKLLAAAMAHTQTLSQQAITSTHIATTFAAAESWVPTLDEPLIGKEARAAVLVRQIRPDDIVEHVVLDGGEH